MMKFRRTGGLGHVTKHAGCVCTYNTKLITRVAIINPFIRHLLLNLTRNLYPLVKQTLLEKYVSNGG